MKRNNIFIVTLFILIFIFGCTTVDVTYEDNKKISKEEELKNRIEILVDALALPKARVDRICNKLISFGEKSVPELSKNIENRIPKIRLLSIFCLGQIYLKTKSKKILKLKQRFINRLNNDRVWRVRLEAASTLCYLGDYRGIPLLIDALNDKSIYVRMVASQVLFSTFNLTFGYKYDDPPKKRKVAIKKWEDWWIKNKDKYL